MSEYISIKQLSRAMGIDRSGVLKYLKGLKYPLPERRQTPDSGHQRTYAWTLEEAKKVIKHRMAYFGVPMSPDDSDWLDWVKERGEYTKEKMEGV